MEEKKVPALRFRGFDNAWEQRRLGELADKVTEKNTLLAKTEVLTNSAEFGIINQREFFDHDIVNENNIGGYYIVRERDFVYNPRISVSAPVGPINCNKLGKSGVMSPLYTVFRVHDIDSVYLEYFFKTSRWHSFMRFNGDSGVRSDRFSIKTELFYKMPIPITKYCEQVKIGKYFSQLDHLISLHQRKLEMLKKVKKSMLEKMFPKNDAKVPEVRFSDFTDAWEQHKVKELCNIGTGKSNTQDQVEDGIYPFYIRSDIPVKSNKYLYDCEAVITIGDGNIGRVFHYVNGKFDLHQRCYKMRDFQDILGKYFYYFFSTRFYDRAMKMTAKATVDSVRLEMISEMDIWKPIQRDEQKKIAKFLTNLDRLISLHQRKLEKLKNIKKSMLEKMFII